MTLNGGGLYAKSMGSINAFALPFTKCLCFQMLTVFSILHDH